MPKVFRWEGVFYQLAASASWEDSMVRIEVQEGQGRAEKTAALAIAMAFR